jgi:glyoxylase-like metal-dependent hydrolase (beta-lactamase superfamily II)
MDRTLHVHQVGGGGLDCNQFLVLTEREAMLVDAGTGLAADVTLAQIKRRAGLVPVRRIFVTHWHHDHTGGAPALARALGAEILMPEVEAIAIREGRADLTLGSAFGAEQEAHPVTGVRPGDEVRVGGDAFTVLPTPGHTAGHTSLWQESTRSLLAGDVVFSHGSFGRVDLPTGSAPDMVRSLERLSEMDVRDLYPGHIDIFLGAAAKHIELALSNARMLL